MISGGGKIPVMGGRNNLEVRSRLTKEGRNRMSQGTHQDAQDERESRHLHIFVNRRKFERGDGVRDEMTGAQIAGLINVPGDNAVVRRDSGPDKSEIGVNETVKVKNGDHFLVTRKAVEGGHVARTY
jgi:multiubiquitin